jgi:biuret amidohydrolase
MKAALLIIDMQNDFNDPSSRLYSPGAHRLVKRIYNLAQTARDTPAPVIWVVQEHRPHLVDFGRETDISPIHCVSGKPGANLMDGLHQIDGDFIIIKRRYSGFFATDLDLLLRALGCNCLFLTGIASDGCVLATALDAHARDYYIRVVSDLTATIDEASHQAVLKIFARMQPGAVITGEQAIQQISDAKIVESSIVSSHTGMVR